jgi:spore coat polysaccharide biosynthesis protein SpsF
MKTGLLITARLKSSRLPLKLLLDINGRTLIQRVIDRCKLVHGIDHIVLCTSTNPQDKPLVDIAKENNIYYFLGSEEDVLQRLSDASKFFGFDYILSITGENPLFCNDHASRTIDLLCSKKADFVMFEGMPIGCAVYGLGTKALRVVCEVKKEVDTEIWGPLINRPDIFNVYTEQVEPFFSRPSLRVTCDYFEDYEFLQAVLNQFKPDETPSLYNALKLLDEHPEYLKIHGHRKQATLSKDFLERINSYYAKTGSLVKSKLAKHR